MSEFDQTAIGTLAEKIQSAVEQSLTVDERVAMSDYLMVRDLRKEKQAEEEKQKELDAKNIGFIQYSMPFGIEKLIDLVADNKQAAIIFLTIVKLMDRKNGLVASQKSLGDMLTMDKAAVSRAIKYLIENEYIRKRNLSGIPMFAVNDRHVWRDRNDRRRFSLWNAIVLVDEELHPECEFTSKSTAVVVPKPPRKRRAGSKV